MPTAWLLAERQGMPAIDLMSCTQMNFQHQRRPRQDDVRPRGTSNPFMFLTSISYFIFERMFHYVLNALKQG